ncbi:hypothetical protein GCM10017783_01990 [Deinococcus piscis]|uniref:PilZ domain-containing protein n=1 Tax=Deinococcus piscis TaxID=394230 RepID=A0ABQ3JXI1_9DEIO|nr:hypothetical protein [Deinococcus piscis]GHF93697.1 hypothetical protein GCM10017783_01990 [Deinococcus piscis]
MTASAYPPVRMQTHMGIRYSGDLLERTAERITLRLTLREFSCFPKPGDSLAVRVGQDQLDAVIVEMKQGAPEEDWDPAVQLRLICRLS